MVSPNTPDSPAGNPSASGAPKSINDVVIRMAGNSQDGIQSIGAFLARLAGRSAQDVMTYMTIPSTISGGPSIFQVRMGTGDILSSGDEADFLVAFYDHSYENHIGSLRQGGILIYDSDHLTVDAGGKDFTAIGVPFTSATIEAVGGSAKEKGKNIFVLGLLCRLFDLEVAKLTALINERFGKFGEDVVRNTMLAFDAGYAWPAQNIRDIYYKLAANADHSGHPQITTDGNTAMTLGLLAAGVRYGAGYPITPWSTIMETLRVELQKYGGMFVQAEDELGAIAYALGFAYSGHLAVTGSSGPGLSLKMEALGWATMAELPLIVINVQRGGPSTGLPTNVEQSDLMQAIYGSHGDAPRIVLAPQNVEDCFHIALEAGRLAREYSTPVIILTDQALASRIEAFDEPDVDAVMVEPGPHLQNHGEEFKPYPLDALTRHAPPGSKIEGTRYPTVTGLEHDEHGHPSGNPAQHQKMTNKRRDKLRQLAKEIARPEIHGAQEGDTLLVGWGSTYGPLREATNRSCAAGQKVGHIHIRHLNPLPPELERIFSRFRQVFVVEMNDRGLYGYGQLATLLRARYANPAIRSITKTDGLAFKVSEIQAGMASLSGTRTASVSAYPET
ncbi:2-oxoacid:acceptor oxidoreductase subunit alpha [Synoicihabitans lomoniglobus]|uniref:2-oxoacid:acceptor oxidoreductase subunit alpha n=2 Tax=Synoicihabitans lomoniglobus TaxID=2909285 RepID=A0AAE9ZUQ7_9BACT|nr:2-oxoacid:acceptor oxidoreductase subunit alpha [Opitutaceae bacterium LMO-M01]